jgi:flagellar protein FlaG
MSNDIQTGAPRAPAALPASGAGSVRHTPPASAQAKPAVDIQPDPQEARRTLQEAMEQLNQQMRRNNRDLSFSLDEVVDTVVVTVKNQEGEIVRQIPNEVALRVAHNLENIKGLMKDEKS